MNPESRLPDVSAQPEVNSSHNGWRRYWFKAMALRVGILPLPVYLVLLVVVCILIHVGKVPADLTMIIGLLALGGFAFMELGKHLPFISVMGATAILAFVVPSALTYYGWLPASVVLAIKQFTKESNFLYLYIAAIIVGSILSMDRHVLLAGFAKIFIPLAVGSVVGGIVGTLVGMAMGYDPMHALFFVVVPLMAGGLGEGAIPLSMGYSLILNQPQDTVFAQTIPVVMLGSFTAVLLAGLLNMVGKKFPHLTGEGRLQALDDIEAGAGSRDASVAAYSFDPINVGTAAITIVTLYLMGMVGQQLFGFPAPITMLFLVVIVKLGRLMTRRLEQGAREVYEFFSKVVTYPLLFAMGIALTPWDKFVSAFTLPTVVTVVATVFSIMASGFVVARFIRMYPIDVAIVNACHSGQGGTGDIAILTAANRMSLMPFAQISTRIGGAITVTLALLAIRHIAA
ncbi:2-hydroxycarboxylate transporter family protein [Pseudomonas typographi]|uniref:2-hydroxycarboxylate transporter family protein n=1 Tax=Pseudomonas typographi TaxID=2715964 RepID=A0ABR7Z8G7_9PSED|nr:2-hydroxycarboxylate transporter family protein [Pseudomonas typographi]MBD1601613.1 2-hydroxycarboxylate transporter family protein [Pseudomonas typographi]